MRLTHLTIALLLSQALCAQNFTNVPVTDLEPLSFSQAEWADVNSDGNLDLIVAGKTDLGVNQFNIFVNNGDQTFSRTSGGVPALSAVRFALGDVNRDNFLDIFISGRNASNQPITEFFINNQNLTFSPLNGGIENLSNGGVSLCDLDNDGDLDVVITGRNTSNNTLSRIYENQNLSFVEVLSVIPDVSNGAVRAFDANNDGYNDLLITGLTSLGVRLSEIYLNQQSFSFESASAGLTGTAFNNVATADLDENGFLDLIITGLDASSPNSTAYFNTNATFTATAIGLPDVGSSAVDAGDLNIDGLSDVFIIGTDASSDLNIEYLRSTAPGSFEVTPDIFPNLTDGSIVFGDYDNDNDLDIFYTGISEIQLEADLVRNDTSAINSVPDAPNGLTASVREDTVLLEWNASSDIETNATALSYNVYVRNNTTGQIIVSPESDLSTGTFFKTGLGNTGLNEQYHLFELPEGNYEWAVQAIDAGFKGSAFSTLANFQICKSVFISNDTAVCFGESVEFNIGTVSDVVNWFTLADGLILSNSNTLTIDPVNRTDTIVAEVNKPFGCTVFDTLILEALPLPNFSLGADTAVCFGDFIDLSVIGFDSVNWFSARFGDVLQDSENYSQQILERDTIVAEVFSATGCVNFDTIIVDVNPLPSFDLGMDTSICFSEDISLQVLGLDSVNWFTTELGLVLSDSENYIQAITQRDTIFTQFFDGNGCQNTDSLIVEVLALPEFDLGADTAVCFEESIPFSLTGFDSVNWFTTNQGLVLEDAFDFIHPVFELDKVIAEVFNSDGCVNLDSIEVAALSLPQFTLGADTALCFGDELLLSVGPGFFETNWFTTQGDTLLEESFFLNLDVFENDTVVAEVSNANLCVNFDTIAIQANPLPQPELGKDFAICFGDLVSLSAQLPDDSVNWFNLAMDTLLLDNNELSINALTSEIIVAQAFNEFLCENTDSLILTVNELPSFTLGADTAICFGETVLLTPDTLFYSIQWSSNLQGDFSTQDSVFIEVLSDEVVSATSEDSNGCVTSDSITIQSLALPEPDIGPDFSVCFADTATVFSEDIFATYEWVRPGFGVLSTDTLVSVRAEENFNLSLKVTDSLGCENSDSLVVTVNPLPMVDAGPDNLKCNEESIVLGSELNEENNTYLWSPSNGLSDETAAQPVTSIDTTTLYTVVATSPEGCQDSDTVLIEVNPVIQVDAGTDTTICIGEVVVLGGTPTASGSVFPLSFEWSPEELLDDPFAPNPSTSPDSATEYRLVVRTGDCQPDTAFVQVNVDPLPIVEVSQDTTIGAGDAIELFAYGGVSYVWSPQEGLSSPFTALTIANPLRSVFYTVEVTDANGCVDTAGVNVFVNNSLFIPNLFTPNNDGNNDRFLVYGTGIQELQFAVYDPAGTEVYQTSDLVEALRSGWDGTRNGTPLDNGNYVWIISGRFFDGSELRFRGQNSGIIRLVR